MRWLAIAVLLVLSPAGGPDQSNALSSPFIFHSVNENIRRLSRAAAVVVGAAEGRSPAPAGQRHQARRGSGLYQYHLSVRAVVDHPSIR